MLDSSLKNARLLIVDDQEANIALLESLLRRDGYADLKSVTDPRQVVGLFDDFQPDLILLDLHMPHFDGFAVMEQLRARIPAEDYLPILVLTADIMPEAKLRALAVGAHDFLSKPFDVTEVALRIHNLLVTRYLHIQQKSQNRILEGKVLERTTELRQRADDLSLINALNVAINKGDDLQKIIVMMAEELHRIFNCIGTITAFPNQDKNSMHVQHMYLPSSLSSRIEDLVAGGISSIPLSIPMTGDGQFAQVIQTGLAKAINDKDTIDAAMAEFTESKTLKLLATPVRKMLGIGSMLLIPLISETESFGLLEMARTEPTSESELFRVRNIAGHLTAAIGRKRSEQSLQESEVRFRRLVQTANDAIITIDSHGVVVDWNMAAETIFGFPAEEVIGKPVEGIVPGQFNPRNLRGMDRVHASTERKIVGKTIEASGLKKDGSSIPVEMSLAEWRMHEGHFFTAIIRDISERKLRENELHAISTLSAALRTAPSRSEMLPVIVRQLGNLIDCDGISAEIVDPPTDDTVVEAASGAWVPIIGFRQPANTGLNASIIQTRQPFHDNDFKDSRNIAVPGIAVEGIHAIAGVPLIAQDQLIGFLWVGRKTEIVASEVRLLVAVADIAANAIRRTTLHEQTLKDANAILKAYDTTLEGWVNALELRDKETEGHARRVVQMSVDLARALGLLESELENLKRGALLHDIGKMGIPDSVLLKPGALDESELVIMRRHPEYAFNLLKPIAYLNPVLDIPYCHHEKWDGSGYPSGLAGESIPLAARIFAIVDVWDALRSDRPYRKAWAVDKTLDHIRGLSGTHFDPRVAKAFIELME